MLGRNGTWKAAGKLREKGAAAVAGKRLRRAYAAKSNYFFIQQDRIPGQTSGTAAVVSVYSMSIIRASESPVILDPLLGRRIYYALSLTCEIKLITSNNKLNLIKLNLTNHKIIFSLQVRESA